MTQSYHTIYKPIASYINMFSTWYHIMLKKRLCNRCSQMIDSHLLSPGDHWELSLTEIEPFTASCTLCHSCKLVNREWRYKDESSLNNLRVSYIDSKAESNATELSQNNNKATDLVFNRIKEDIKICNQQHGVCLTTPKSPSPADRLILIDYHKWHSTFRYYEPGTRFMSISYSNHGYIGRNISKDAKYLAKKFGFRYLAFRYLGYQLQDADPQNPDLCIEVPDRKFLNLSSGLPGIGRKFNRTKRTIEIDNKLLLIQPYIETTHNLEPFLLSSRGNTLSQKNIVFTDSNITYECGEAKANIRDVSQLYHRAICQSSCGLLNMESMPKATKLLLERLIQHTALERIELVKDFWGLLIWDPEIVTEDPRWNLGRFWFNEKKFSTMTEVLVDSLSWHWNNGLLERKNSQFSPTWSPYAWTSEGKCCECRNFDVTYFALRDPRELDLPKEDYTQKVQIRFELENGKTMDLSQFFQTLKFSYSLAQFFQSEEFSRSNFVPKILQIRAEFIHLRVESKPDVSHVYFCSINTKDHGFGRDFEFVSTVQLSEGEMLIAIVLGSWLLSGIRQYSILICQRIDHPAGDFLQRITCLDLNNHATAEKWSTHWVPGIETYCHASGTWQEEGGYRTGFRIEATPPLPDPAIEMGTFRLI
jgi:hypothetical protein